MKYYLTLLSLVLVVFRGVYSQTITLGNNGLNTSRKNVTESMLKGLFGNRIYWGIDYPNYYFDKQLLAVDNDTLCKIINIDSETLMNFYISWKYNDNFVFSESAPIFDSKRKNKEVVKKNKEVISISGMFYIPNKYILTVIKSYCKGLCMTEKIILFEYKEGHKKELNIVYSKVLNVS